MARLQKPKHHPLESSAFYRLPSPRKLAEILDISDTELRRLSRPDGLYREFGTPKGEGGTRHIEEPRAALKRVQSRIAGLLSRIEPAEYLYCPVKRRCYVSNAARHKDNRVVRCIDVKKFFPNTPRRRVYRFFKEIMQCPGDVAGVLANLATYQGHLPTGSPLSPIMAHYAYIDVWGAIAELARANDLTMTVYVDDVTLSGQRLPDAVMWDVKKLLHGAGLRYHKEKKYVDRPAEVTGVILRSGELAIPNRQHLKLRNAREVRREAVTQDEIDASDRRVGGLIAQRKQIRREGELTR
jgi:hypothetical protein